MLPCNSITLLGEASNSTDNVVGKPVEGLGNYFQSVPIPADDRLVFTEDNPDREIMIAGQLATVARVMKSYDAAVAASSLAAARAIAAEAFDRAKDIEGKAFAMAELYVTTGEKPYMDRLVALGPEIVAHVDRAGWAVASVISTESNTAFKSDLRAAVAAYEGEARRQRQGRLTLWYSVQARHLGCGMDNPGIRRQTVDAAQGLARLGVGCVLRQRP